MENQKFIPGNLVVVAGRPAMGKTQFLCSFASKRNAEHPVLYYSLELSEQQIIKRVDTEFKIVDTPALSFQNIIDRTRELVKEEGVHTVVIDYLQLIRDYNPESVLATLKSLAVKLGIEMVVGVLVKRSHDTEVKAPTKEEIGLGGVENIDRFIPLHHPEYYNGNRTKTVKNGDFTEFDKLDEDQKIEIMKTWDAEMRIKYLSRNSITDDDLFDELYRIIDNE